MEDKNTNNQIECKNCGHDELSHYPHCTNFEPTAPFKPKKEEKYILADEIGEITPEDEKPTGKWKTKDGILYESVELYETPPLEVKEGEVIDEPLHISAEALYKCQKNTQKLLSQQEAKIKRELVEKIEEMKKEIGLIINLLD